jgi:hypothetical protein
MAYDSSGPDLVFPGQGPTRGVSVTLTQGTLAAAKKYAGERGLSSLIEEALAHELHLRQLDELIAWMAEEAGPPDPGEVERILAVMRQQDEAFVARKAARAGDHEAAA